LTFCHQIEVRLALHSRP